LTKKTLKTTAMLMSLTSVIALTTACSTEAGQTNTNESEEVVEKETTNNEIVTGNEMVVMDKVQVELKEDFTFNGSENDYILEYTKGENYFARLEILGEKIDLEEEKAMIISESESVGTVSDFTTNLKTDNFHEYYQNADLYIHVSSDTENQNVVVKNVDGQYVRIVMNFPNEESAEGITPYMIDIMNSLKIMSK
jgi:hypothetical protein